MVEKAKHSNNFKRLALSLIHRSRLFALKTVRMRAPDGHEFQHDVVFHPGAAVIVPILKPERFVLVRQYRTAVRQMILEFPAGTLESGEAPLACARRELVEEIGYQARRWRKLASFYPAPGISNELMHLFLATDLVPKEGVLEKDEFIEKRIVSFSRLQKMILDGMIIDAKTIAGFFYYCQKRRSR